ncbi:ornithine--oxo-acid transaminase [Rickettsiales bacterium]|nr:ornithine--oxo-acid transaminase [Rickettsiales bacterium]
MSVIEKELKYCAHNYLPLPVVLTKGEGCFLYDDSGKKYIDMMSAYSAVSHGHCNKRLLGVLGEQANKLCITSRAFYTDKLADFAEKLCKFTKMDAMLPMNTGAEAVETAIKAARLWGYKVKNITKHNAQIIVANQNFHGRTTTIVGFSSEKSYKDDFGPFAPGFTNIPFGDISAFKNAITKDTCAILLEPMQGEGGIIVPPDGYLKQVQQVCKDNNILLILDEIQTGLGRTGKDFAFQYEIDKPDCLILGKALGGGILPVSAFLASSQIMDLFTPGTHGSTFGGNPLACAIALEALKIIEEDNLTKNSYELGKHLVKRLKNIKSPAIKDIRGKGLWVGVEIDPKYASARKICEELMLNGVLSKETHEVVVRLAPPLVIDKKTLDNAIDIFEKILGKIK